MAAFDKNTSMGKRTNLQDDSNVLASLQQIIHPSAVDNENAPTDEQDSSEETGEE